MLHVSLEASRKVQDHSAVTEIGNKQQLKQWQHICTTPSMHLAFVVLLQSRSLLVSVLEEEETPVAED